MGGLQGGCRRRRRPCGMRKTRDQLGAEPLPLSKIRDGSAERNGRPRGAAVFEFDIVPGTSPSWSLKVYALRGRTLYRRESTVGGACSRRHAGSVAIGLAVSRPSLASFSRDPRRSCIVADYISSTTLRARPLMAPDAPDERRREIYALLRSLLPLPLSTSWAHPALPRHRQ